MSCSLCGSENGQKLLGEIAIRFPGLKGLELPIVWVFGEVAVCLDCGNAQFTVPETELRTLQKGRAAGAG